jgi:acetate kinase
MSGAILTLNAGSSSLKFALFPGEGDTPLATGLADRIGPEATFRLSDGAGGALLPGAVPDLTDHHGAVQAVLAALTAAFPAVELAAVGHRVVHGGPDLSAPAVIDDALLDVLGALAPFAPLHQPHNLAGIRAARAAFPGTPQIACFDTGFHRAHPFVNDTFALPRRFYDKGVRRYGFHGLSYEYIVAELAASEPALARGRIIVAHLGNGASACAIRDGRSVSSTMGFSALDGLPMGTRCGQLDPGVLLCLMDQEGLGPKEIADLLYQQSGLLGMSGLSNDMRRLLASHSREAAEAVAYFVVRVRREIGALAAALGGIDALVFCGGIGENARPIRARICETMEWMGISLDPARNAANDRRISRDGAAVTVLVIPTNEELVIARGARGLVRELAATSAEPAL